jgi:hypothetical protein
LRAVALEALTHPTDAAPATAPAWTPEDEAKVNYQ